MNEITATISGNLVAAPELRYTPDGTPVLRMRVASTPRYFSQSAGAWADGETVFMDVTAWRSLAENLAASVGHGSRVIVTGQLRQRSWEAEDGTRRTAYEIQAEDAGPSLRMTVARPERVTPDTAEGGPV